ncbi:MAG: FixH family protein [SAR324 cluster bacterium]|nr:FixH family protein [SAR324 cluster bacterium]
MENQKFRIHPWPLGIFLFFLMVVGVNMGVWWTAIQSPHQLVTDDYYAQSLVYDKIIDAQTITENKGWQAQLEYQHKNQHTQLQIALEDETGQPVEGLSGNLTAYRPSNLKEDTAMELKEVSPGTYNAQFPQISTGLWEMTVSFQWDDNPPVYYKKFRLHIRPEADHS